MWQALDLTIWFGKTRITIRSALLRSCASSCTVERRGRVLVRYKIQESVRDGIVHLLLNEIGKLPFFARRRLTKAPTVGSRVEFVSVDRVLPDARGKYARRRRRRGSCHRLVRWADGCGCHTHLLKRRWITSFLVVSMPNAATEATLAIQGCWTNSSSMRSMTELKVTFQTMRFILSASPWRARVARGKSDKLPPSFSKHSVSS